MSYGIAVQTQYGLQNLDNRRTAQIILKYQETVGDPNVQTMTVNAVDFLGRPYTYTRYYLNLPSDFKWLDNRGFHIFQNNADPDIYEIPTVTRYAGTAISPTHPDFISWEWPLNNQIPNSNDFSIYVLRYK